MRDRGPSRPTRARALKHFLWLMVAWWTGGAWVLYFADAPTLVKDLATRQAPFIAYLWIGILTFTTYTLAGHMREQVCLYMCPWPRIQAALTDEYALNVTYRYDRGEPRCSVKKSRAAARAGQPAGDCVDCLQCVHVCPTGVDIRDGAESRLHPMRAVHRCLRRRHGARSAGRRGSSPTTPISTSSSGSRARRRFYKLVRLRTALYAADHRRGRRHHDLHAGHARQRRHQRHPRPQSDVRAAVGRRAAQRLYDPHRQQAAQERANSSLSVDGLPSSLIDFVGLPPRADGRQSSMSARTRRARCAYS